MDDLVAAEDQIEQAWCELDREWHRLLDEASDEAARVVDDAHAEAAAIVLEAHERADRIVAEARAAAAATPAPAVEDPTGIREALQRLRSELSHVVDAALDAFPAIEATAELFAPSPEPEPEPEVSEVSEEPVIDLTADDPVAHMIEARPRRLRRLLRLAR